MGLLQEIYSGWKFYAFKSPEIEELAKNRAKTCVSCKELRRNKTCKICGCFVPAKVRSEKSKCPLKLW